MNKYYSYPNIELWETEKWASRVAPSANIIEHIQAITPIVESDYVPSFDTEIDDPKKHPNYRFKLRGYLDPVIPDTLAEKGLTFHATSQGGKDSAGHPWFLVCPTDAVENWKKLPVLLAFDVEDESSPLWMMRAVKRYQKYIDMLERSKDFILAVLVNEEVGYDRVYFNIMQEFSVLFPCDIKHFYLDVSVALKNGALKDIPGFVYYNAAGEAADPDACVEKFGDLEVPVLNIVGNWGNCDSLERGLIMTYKMNDGRFDREWLLHSEVGKRMMQDMMYEYKYDTIHDPKFLKEMEDKGFVYDILYNDWGDRYTVAVPRESMEKGEKVPLVLIIQEMYEGNEHLAVTAHSYLAEWLEIAAQGECALMFFALEDDASNDRVLSMIAQCADKYNFDLTRVYGTGHSHDGYFTYSMANRHPDLFAAIAILGNVPCPKNHAVDVFDYTVDHEIINHDIPVVVISGLCESGFPVDEKDMKERWIPRWKQVFRNYRIPGRTEEDILAAFESEDYTKRVTALPGDKFRTLWCDGIEHYFVDFINEDGKEHLRVIRQQNMPHTVTPMMCTLSWDFLRRFKRAPETHEIIEIF